PFDGRDLLAGGLLGRSLARAHGDAVDMHRAGAAKARAAAELGAGHLQLLADDPQERRVVGSIDLPRLPIDNERDHVSSVADAEIARRDSPDRPRRLPRDAARTLRSVFLLLLMGDLEPAAARPSREAGSIVSYPARRATSSRNFGRPFTGAPSQLSLASPNSSA